MPTLNDLLEKPKPVSAGQRPTLKQLLAQPQPPAQPLVTLTNPPAGLPTPFTPGIRPAPALPERISAKLDEPMIPFKELFQQSVIAPLMQKQGVVPGAIEGLAETGEAFTT